MAKQMVIAGLKWPPEVEAQVIMAKAMPRANAAPGFEGGEKELVLLFSVGYGFFWIFFFFLDFLWDGRIQLTYLENTSKSCIFLINSKDRRSRNSRKDIKKDSSCFSHASREREDHGQHPFSLHEYLSSSSSFQIGSSDILSQPSRSGMFKVEFPLRDGLGSNDVTGKVLLNSFCSAQFQVIGMQLLRWSD